MQTHSLRLGCTGTDY